MAVVCSDRTGKRPCNKCIHCDKASRSIHPDIQKIGRQDDKLIVGVDQIRGLKRDVYIIPNESEQKAYIVDDADSMNVNAQNAFLQILEEPPAHAVFILCAENPAALLPTVRSRCIELKMLPEDQPARSDAKSAAISDADEEENKYLEELIDGFMQAMSNNNVKLMECMFLLDKLDRQSFLVFLAQSRKRIITTLRENQGVESADINKKLIQAESIILKAGEMLDLNVSPGHISGFICASLLENGKRKDFD